MEHLQWFWGYAKKRVPKLAAGLVISLCVSMLGMVSPYVSGKIVGSIQDGTWEATLFASLAVIVGAAFARAVLRYIMLRVFERASQDLVLEMRNDTYAWIHRQNFSFFDSNRVGDIMARMTGDLDAIRHFVAYVIYGSVENLVIFIAAITLMFIVSWQLALLMLLTAPVIFASGFRQAKEIKPAFFQIREKFSRLNTVCEENIGGNRVVKAFTKEDQEIAKFTEANNEFYNSHINANSIWVKHLPILEFCAGILNVFLLCGGGILCALGRLQLWQLVAVNGYLWAVSNPLRQMGFLINDTQNFFASVDKIFGMVRKKIYIETPEDAAKPERLIGKVEFEQVSFKYDRHGKITELDNISFVAEPGETIGIVGATGAGKSTLVSLISRFYDTSSGRVLVDGKDVREYDLQALRRNIAMASQDVFLFSDTVEGNIAYGDPEAPVEMVEDSARDACAHSFILEMEDGYDSIVGERGVGLSGGQKQRLSLARAFAADPAILILDDTTSAVDMETEHEMQKALKRRSSKCTTFIIAHRISSVKNASKILFMENGRIAEQGTHEELLALKGRYYGMFVSQYGDFAKKVG